MNQQQIHPELQKQIQRYVKAGYRVAAILILKKHKESHLPKSVKKG